MAVSDILPLDLDNFSSVAGVDRETVSGRDQSGLPVESWVSVYSNLPCLLDAHSQGEHTDFEQRALDFRYLCYFPPLSQSGPGLPDIRIRDRLNVGTWPDGSTKYIDVIDVVDELDAGVILVVTGLARKPG